MTPLDRLADVVSRISGPVGDEDRVVVLVAVAPLLIDVARAARQEAVARKALEWPEDSEDTDADDVAASRALFALERAITALDSAITKELGK